MAGDWRDVALEDVADELTVGYVGPMASEYVDEGIPFLRSLNVDPLRINKNDLKFITPEFHSRIRKSRLTPGDVVIVRTGKPGACSVVPEWLADANCSDLVIVRCGPQLDNRFLAYYVNTVACDHIAAHLVGAVQQHFNVGSRPLHHVGLWCHRNLWLWHCRGGRSLQQVWPRRLLDKEYVREFWLPYISKGQILPTKWQVERGPTPYWLSLLGWLPLRWLLAATVAGVMALVVWLLVLKQQATPPAALRLGPVVTIGHNTGFPSVLANLNFDNPTRAMANFSNFLSVKLTSPEGKDHVLAVEGMLVAGVQRPLLPAIPANAGDMASFDYSYFTYEPSFVTLHQDIMAMAGSIPSNAMPDPQKELVPKPIAERAAKLARDNFIWSAGRWKLELAYVMDGKNLTVVRYFDLSQTEVDEMKAIIELYPSGIGFFPSWKFLRSGRAKPLLEKVLSD